MVSFSEKYLGLMRLTFPSSVKRDLYPMIPIYHIFLGVVDFGDSTSFHFHGLESGAPGLKIAWGPQR